MSDARAAAAVVSGPVEVPGTAHAPSTTPAEVFSMLHRAFGDPVMERVFSEAATVEAWLRTEAELARSQAAVGDLDAARAEAIAAACVLANVDLGGLWQGTANVGYPILPLVRQVDARLPEEDRGSMHLGATTQDIMDTGLALQLSDAIARLDELAGALGDALADLADRHAGTVMAGRTHGQQAVPTTLGAKAAVLLRQVMRGREDLRAARARACVVSLHGAAGTSAGLGPRARDVRAGLASRLGLEAGDGPWHTARDGLAALGGVCARLAATCARLAREVIDLSRTEIAELGEAGGHHRGASSTMPQKANPIDSETVLGMAVTATALAAPLHRAMEAGHERAAGEWQVEWHVLPQLAVMTAGCLLVSERIVRGLRVDPERMAANLGLEQGRTLAEAYMLELAPRLGRERAHDLVYEAALVSRDERIELREALARVMGDGAADLPRIGPQDYLGDAPRDARDAVAAWRQAFGPLSPSRRPRSRSRSPR
jgi:3-carboxy-cis,cis-muconate cycloisomerase